MSRNFSLGDHYEEFIDQQIQTGRFDNATEFVRAALHLLEDYETSQKTRHLRALIDEGDTDIEYGRVIAYKTAADLSTDIIREGQDRLKNVR